MQMSLQIDESMVSLQRKSYFRKFTKNVHFIHWVLSVRDVLGEDGLRKE